MVPPASFLRPLAASLAAALGGIVILRLWPTLELALFARGAAELAGLFVATPVQADANGWQLPSASLPVVVTAACSATDFFLMVATLLAWHLTRRGHSVFHAALTGPLLALPLAIFINALRIVTVMQAHRWVIPLLPDAYGAFLHMLTGAAIFLPALIGLNVLLESHARPRPPIHA